MPRVHVQTARTDRYNKGLSVPTHKTKSGFRIDRSKPADENDTIFCRKGDTYYWWQFRYSGKIFSTEYPKQSQLTQSEFYGAVYSLQEEADDWEVNSEDDFTELLEYCKSTIEEIRDEQEKKRDNMISGNENLENTPVAELLQERYDNMEEIHDELESLDWESFEDEDDENEEDEDSQEFLDHCNEQKEKITEVLGNVN